MLGAGGQPDEVVASRATKDSKVDAPAVEKTGAKIATEEKPSVAIDLGRVHRVLHIGDSEVGYASGLCKDLGARFKAAGIAYTSESWTSEGLKSAETDGKIEKALSFKPDLVLLNLGTNNLASPSPSVLAPLVESIVKKISKQPCIWIGPPHLPSATKLEANVVKVIADHAAPCRFFDSQRLALSLQPDNIHPDGRGAQVWAENLWSVLVQGRDLVGPLRP